MAARTEDSRQAGEYPGHQAGSAEFTRLQFAMLGAAMAAFALLYCTQPLLPELRRSFHASPTAASLTVSATTGCLALGIVPLSSIAEAYGRVRVMRLGLATVCALVLISAAAPSLVTLIVLRALVGVALAAVVAVAMGHVGDEVHPRSLGGAMGVYVAGNSLGGVGGRLAAAAGGDAGGWRVGVLAVGVLGVLAALVFSLRVPEPRRFTPVPFTVSAMSTGVRTHLRDSGIMRLCAVAFLLMGGFVAVYNYLAFRLTAAPFALSQGAVGLFFLAYLAGTASSAVAGRLTGRLGVRRTLAASCLLMLAGLLGTLPNNTVGVIAGLVVFTAGFFGAHAVASGWVARRAIVGRAQASALYLLAYYAGSSVLGAATGIAFSRGGWPWLVTVVGGYIVTGIALGLSVHPRSAVAASAAP